ncbi:MAG: four helix bundle protein [Endomicrobiia bacterium]|nr:four helix bundle protein [Endomicrobiia bacterium]
MAQYEHLPIYKKMFDLTVYTEKIAQNFSRYHKYTLGAEMRNLTRGILVLLTRANSMKDKKATLLEVRDKLEELKILARLAKEVKAFSSFNSFEHFVKELVDVSRQNEGWLRSQNPPPKL